jgi:hypothetical protein
MATLTPEIAQDLIWRSMVTGVPTTEFEKYGGYEAVDAMYKAGGGEYSHDAIPVDLRNQLGQQVAQTGAGNLSILEKTGNALSAAAIENMAKSGTISSLPLFMERGIPIAEAAMPTAQKYLSIMPALSGTLQPTAKPTQPTQQPSLLPPAFSGSGLSIPSAYPSQAQTLDFLSPTGTITPSPQLPVSTLPGYTFSPITTPTVSSIVPSAVPQPQAPVDTQLPSIQQSVQDQFQQRVFGVPRSDIEQFIASRSPQPRVPEYSPMLTPTVSRQQLEQLNRLYGIPQTPPQDDNMQFFREGGAVKKFADGGPSSGVRRLEMSGYKDGGGVSDNPFAQMVEEEQRTQDQLLGNINRQLSELISRYRSGDLTVTEKELLPFFPGYTEYDIAQMYGTTTEATSPRMSEKIKPFTVDMIPNVKRRGEAVESDFDRMVREGKLLDPMMPKRVMELSKGGEVTNDEFIQEMITGTRPEDFPETSPVDKKAGELLRALSEGTRGFVGAEPIEPGSEAYRTGQALANMPAVGVVAATAKGAGKAKNALKSIVDPARLFEEVEKIPRNQIIDDLRNAHIGGVGDFGDSNAKYYFSQIPGGKEYIKKSQQVAKKNLGDRFMGYRLMSKDQFEDLQAGDVGDLLSFSLDQNIAEALRNFVTNQKRTDLVVAEVPLTPKHIVAFGHSGEKEIIVDTGVGWSMDEFKQAAPLKKAKGGEVTNDEFIQEMMVGTAPSEESQQTTGEYIKGLYKENIPVHARVYLETLLGKKDPVTAEDFTKEELARIDSLIQKTEAERLGKILKRQADLQSSLERTTKRLSPQKDIAKKMVEDPDWIAYSELNKKPTSPEVANEQFDAWTRFYNKFADQAFVHEDITLIMGDRDPKKVQSYLDEKKQKNKQTTEYLKDRLSKVNQALDAVQGKGLKGAVEDYSAYGSTSPKEMEDTDISRTLGRFNYETLPSGRRVVKDTYDFYNEYRAPMVEEYEKMGPAKKALSVLLEAVKDPVQLPSVLGNAYIGRDGRPVKVEYDPKDLPVKRQDGSPSQGEISDDMFVGTRPTDETTRPGILPPELREAIDVPLDFANLLIRGTAAVPIGGAAGLYKGITGGKYGTQEGVKEADTEAARMMAKITGEPKTQTAKDVLQFVGDKAQEYKLDAALPQLLTLPSPGPGAASALMRSYELAETPPLGTVKLAGDKGVKPATPPTDQMGFYSPAEKAVMGLPQDKGTASQMLAQITKTQGVKPVELRATGLEDYLKGKGNEPVTKQEIQDFLTNNRVQVDEVVLGRGLSMSPEAKRLMEDAEKRMMKADQVMAPFFEQQEAGSLLQGQEPYSTFYRIRGPLSRKIAKGDQEALAELDALNLPPDIRQAVLDFGAAKTEYVKYSSQARRMEKPKFDGYNTSGGTNAREIYLTLPGEQMPSSSPPSVNAQGVLVKPMYATQPKFTAPSPHSVSPEADANRLAHIFLDERKDAKGNNVLFVQEMQSDWAQQGRDKGFAIVDKLPEGYSVKQDLIVSGQPWGVVDKNGQFVTAGFHRSKEDAVAEVIQRLNTYKLPTAPFVTNTEDWVNLALKRVIKEAVDNDIDTVAFIKGGQAADKYSLRTFVDYISADRKTTSGVEHLPGATDDLYVFIAPKDSLSPHAFYVGPDGIIKEPISADVRSKFLGEPLSNVIGKEAAEKLLSTKIGESQVLRDEGLTLGGKGMEGFYDNILPKTAEKLLKKLGGGKVEPVEVVKGAPSQMPYEANAFLDWMEQNHPGTKRSEAARAWGMGMENNQFVKDFYEATKADQYLGFKITPEMKEMVKTEGLPKFAAGGEVTDFIKRAA